VNLALGVATFGLHHAVNESREWLYLLTTTAFVVAAGPWTSRFWRPWFALAVGAMGLAWLGVAKHGLHSATSQIVINGQLVDGRPLNSAGAAALAFALIVLLGSRTISVRRKIVFGTAAICTLIAVQQRTVWAVLTVVFLVWAAASLRRHGTARHRRLAATSVAVLGAVAVVLAAGVATGSVFDQSLAETTAKHSTLTWRVTGWTDLLHTNHSAAGLLLGFRFGTGYRRIIDGQVILASPHSFYLATVLRLGLIGLVALAFLYWNGWKYRRQAAASLGITPLTVALLLIGLLVFSLTYQPSFILAAQVAALLVWDPAREPHPAADPVPAPAAQLLGEGR
jgi:O-antigen ligase